MAALDLVTGILSIAGSGGITGLVGGGLSFVQQRSANKQKLEELKLTNNYKKEILQLEMAMAEKEQQAEIRVETIKGESERYLADAETMQASFAHALKDVGNTATEGIFLRFVEGSRRFVRPFASYYAMIILTVLTFWMFGLWKEAEVKMSQEQLYDLSLQLLNAIVYLSTTIVMWWFSSRGVTLFVGSKSGKAE